MDRPANENPAGSSLGSQSERSGDSKSPGSPQSSHGAEDQDRAPAALSARSEIVGDDEDDADFDLTFNLDHARGSGEYPGQSRQIFRSEEYRQLFHLPPEEVLIQDFNCALQKKILLQGHMYLFEHYVCFYSNIFGYEKKKVIILKDVTCVRKGRTAGLFPNAIEIVAWGKKNFFASFLSRDEAYRLIVEGWARHSRYAKLVSDSQSNMSPALPASNPVETPQGQHEPCTSESSLGNRDNAEVPDDHTNEANGPEISESLQPIDARDGTESMSTDITEAPAVTEVSSWVVKDENAPEVLEQYKMILEGEFPVDVRQFFELFYSNESVNFCEAFHRKCGDEDFQCTEWAKHHHFGHVRDVSFRHPINFYIGPKSTYCQEVQRYRVYRNSHLILETSQQMNDIPYGDHFRVEGRWDVVNLSGRDSPHCSIRIYVDVSFSKKTVWKGKIEQGTMDECKETFSTWMAEARRTLQERGVDGGKSAQVKTNNQSSPQMVSESTKSRSFSNSKRKLDGEYGGAQVQSKISKNNSSAPSSITVREVGQPNEHSCQAVSSDPVTPLKNLKQGCTVISFTSLSQMKLVIAICVVAVILLAQTGAIITLSRSSRAHPIPFLSRTMEYCGSPSRHFVREDAIRWLEQRILYLQEEITMAEAHLQNMQDSLNLLSVNLKLVEKIPKDAASSA